MGYLSRKQNRTLIPLICFFRLHECSVKTVIMRSIVA